MSYFGSIGRQQVYDATNRDSAFYKHIPVEFRKLYYPHSDCIHYVNGIWGYSEYAKINPNISAVGSTRCAAGYYLNYKEIKWGCQRFCPGYISCPRNYYNLAGEVPSDLDPSSYTRAGWLKLAGYTVSAVYKPDGVYYRLTTAGNFGIVCEPSYRELVIINPYTPVGCNDDKIYTISVPLGGNICGRHDILNVATEKMFANSEIEALSVQYDVVWFHPLDPETGQENSFDLRNRFVINRSIACYYDYLDSRDPYEEIYPDIFPLVHPNPNNCEITTRLKPKDFNGIDTYKFADNFRLDWLELFGNRYSRLITGSTFRPQVYLKSDSDELADIPALCRFEVYSGMCHWIPSSEIVTEKGYPKWPNSLGIDNQDRVLERDTDYYPDPISGNIELSDSYQSDRENIELGYIRTEYHVIKQTDLDRGYIELATKALEVPIEVRKTYRNTKTEVISNWLTLNNSDWNSGVPRNLSIADCQLSVDDVVKIIYKACRTRCIEVSVSPVVAENRVAVYQFQEPVKLAQECTMFRIRDLVEESIEYVWVKDEVVQKYDICNAQPYQPVSINSGSYYRSLRYGEFAGVDIGSAGYCQQINDQGGYKGPGWKGGYKEYHRAIVKKVPFQQLLTLSQYQGRFAHVFARGIAYVNQDYCKRYTYTLPEFTGETISLCWHGNFVSMPVTTIQIPIVENITGSINFSCRPAYARTGKSRCMNQVDAAVGNCLLASMRGESCAMRVISNCVSRLPVADPSEYYCDEINQDYLQRYIESGIPLCNISGRFYQHLIRSFTRPDDPENCPCQGVYPDAWQNPEEELVYYVNGQPAIVPAGSQLSGKAGKVGSCPPGYMRTSDPTSGTNILICGLMCFDNAGTDYFVRQKWTDIHQEYEPLYKKSIPVGQSIPFELEITQQMNELLANMNSYSEFGLIFESDYGIQHKFNLVQDFENPVSWGGINDRAQIPYIPYLGTIEQMGLEISQLELIVVTKLPNSVKDNGVAEVIIPSS